MTGPEPEVAAVFDGYPERLRDRLLELRARILAVAGDTPGVGALDETLKWGEPAYRPANGAGTTIRVAPLKGSDTRYGLFVPCGTALIETFRAWLPPGSRFEGNRAVVFDVDEPLPGDTVDECIAAALTYHRRRRGR